MKKYRVNESEQFNLYSMHDKLKCIEIDMQEAPAHTYTDEQWDEVQERISEVEELMEKAYCVGALVDWTTLKRIREIKEERQLMRYNACMHREHRRKMQQWHLNYKTVTRPGGYEGRKRGHTNDGEYCSNVSFNTAYGRWIRESYRNSPGR